MKVAFALAAAMATLASTSLAADINVLGAQTQPMAATTTVGIATKSTLDDATALLNKNTLATDNNVFIARSNVLFMQNDRLALREKVAEALKRGSEQDMTATTLTKNVMRAVAAPDTDTALMTKASSVVAAAPADATALAQRIADFVDAVGLREMEQEQVVQSQTPRGVVVLVGTKDLLRQPTAVINKNIAASDNQVSVANSDVVHTQNDQVALAGGAKVADMVAPAGVLNVGQAAQSGDQYRVGIAYREEDADEQLQEQWGLGWRLGWRYPLGYWNAFGRGFYGGGCGLGLARGPFFYC